MIVVKLPEGLCWHMQGAPQSCKAATSTSSPCTPYDRAGRAAGWATSFLLSIRLSPFHKVQLSSIILTTWQHLDKSSPRALSHVASQSFDSARAYEKYYESNINQTKTRHGCRVGGAQAGHCLSIHRQKSDSEGSPRHVGEIRLLCQVSPTYYTQCSTVN